MFFAVDGITGDCISFSENLDKVVSIAQDYCDEDTPEIMIFKAEIYGKIYLPREPLPVFTQDLNAE